MCYIIPIFLKILSSPMSKGGKTNIDNLRPLCPPCNTSMGSKNAIVFAKQYFPNSPFIKTF